MLTQDARSRIDAAYDFLAKGQIRWLGTAGFTFQVEDEKIVFDPFYSRHPAGCPMPKTPWESLRDVKAVFAGHGHFDHIGDIPRLAAESGATVMAPYRIMAGSHLRKVPPKQRFSLFPWQKVSFNHFSLTVVPISHVKFDWPLIRRSMMRRMFLREWRKNLSLLLKYPELSTYGYLLDFGKFTCFLTSSAGAAFPAYRRIAGEVDLFLCPLQGHSRIEWKAREIIKAVQPKLVIPHHWDNFYAPISSRVDPERLPEVLKQEAATAQVLVEIVGY